MSETTAEERELIERVVVAYERSASFGLSEDRERHARSAKALRHLLADLEAAEERLADLDLSCARCGQEHEQELAVCSGCAKALTEEMEEAEERAQKAEARVKQREESLAGKKAWIEAALKDYERLREWLHARGVTEWEDTISAVFEQIAVAERAYAVRVLEEAEKTHQTFALYPDVSDETRARHKCKALGFRELAARIKAGEE